MQNGTQPLQQFGDMVQDISQQVGQAVQKPFQQASSAVQEATRNMTQ
ncbi:hypothetical protein [Terrilactibacillus laevilacticus]|uniref:Uncharacterized protein n=2 Tax=Terrilactibacillus laevilacticus TaxID=1380157 RepID=A0ABW5PTA3_9BACI